MREGGGRRGWCLAPSAVSNAWARAEPRPSAGRDGPAQPSGRRRVREGRPISPRRPPGRTEPPSPLTPSHTSFPSPPPFLPRPGSNGTEPFPQPPAPGRALTKPHNAPRRAGTGGSRQPLAPSGEVWLVCARRRGLGFLALAWEKGARGQPPGAGRWAEASFSGGRA